MKRNSNYIQLEDCIDNNLYVIDARNANIGIFKKETGYFIISRIKFSDNFIFEEYHYDIYKINPELECFGTVKPIKDLGEIPFNYDSMNKDVLLKFLNDYSKQHREEIENEMNNYVSDYI